MKFLSPEWFAALDRALQSVVSDEQSPAIGIGQVVTDAPQGEVRYTVFVGANANIVEVGSTDRAAVTIVTDYATARAIATGSSTADLLYQGKLKIRGDARALLSSQEALSSMSAALGGLAGETEF